MSKTSRSVFWFFFLAMFFTASQSFAQNKDSIFMKNDSVLKCTILKIENNLIYSRTIYNHWPYFKKIKLKDVRKYTLSGESSVQPGIKYDSLLPSSPDKKADTVPLLASETYPSFRIKTELFQLLGLKPNVYIDYKINRHTGIEFGLLYNCTGVTWSAPYYTLGAFGGDQFRWVECWNLKGWGADLGVKFYYKPTKFISVKCKGDWLNFNKNVFIGEREDDQRNEKMNRYDINLQVVYGTETKRRSNYFREIYVGIGVLCAIETHSIMKDYWSDDRVKSSSVNFVPTIHFGINLGWKTIPKRRTEK